MILSLLKVLRQLRLSCAISVVRVNYEHKKGGASAPLFFCLKSFAFNKQRQAVGLLSFSGRFLLPLNGYMAPAALEAGDILCGYKDKSNGDENGISKDKIKKYFTFGTNGTTLSTRIPVFFQNRVISTMIQLSPEKFKEEYV